jgi:hypothetical protein
MMLEEDEFVPLDEELAVPLDEDETPELLLCS